MHSNDFLEESKVKIIKIIGEESDGRHIIADLVTSQFSRVTQKRHEFSVEQWERVKERGYVE